MKIVGVTACPTGAAHTYIPVERLEVTARNSNHRTKFEAQGIKAEDQLSKQEIREADVVTLTVDKEIELDRFAGRKVKRVSTSRAVKEPQAVMDEASRDIDVFVMSNEKEPVANEKKPVIYNHFINDVNYMLPPVTIGGIVTALSFAFGITVADPSSTGYNVLAAAFSGIGGDTAFVTTVPVLGAGIATSIIGKADFAPRIVTRLLASTGGSDFLGGMTGGVLAGCICNFLANKTSVKKEFSAIYQLIITLSLSASIIGLLIIFVIKQPIAWVLDALTNWLGSLGNTPGLLFGLLIGVTTAADVGGPINESISTFSISLMSAGVNAPTAAYTVVGMAPPLGITLATLLFEHKFTKEERTSGQSHRTLGASHITEGAIPFAVSDPTRVMPNLMTSSVVATGIPMAVGVISMASHGGIRVMLVPDVMNNLPMHVLAIASSVVTTVFMLGLLKKTVKKEKQGR